MTLTEHFTLNEFTRSQKADDLNIDNTPTEEHIKNLQALCVHVLEPIRNKLGKPIRITSGYRCAALNKALRNSSKKSQHMEGKAADIIVDGYTPHELFEFIKRSGYEHDQLIEEPTWVHISWNGFNNRNEDLLATMGEDGKMKYKAV